MNTFLLIGVALLLGIQACGSKVYDDAAVEEEAATIAANGDATAQEQTSNASEEVHAMPQTAQSESGSVFGAAPQLESDPVGLREAIDHTSTGEEIIRVRGEVVDVCQKKGCWMMLREGADEVRVTFKDYGFFVPLDLSGSEVTVEGVLQSTILTQDEARHYAEDAGASSEEIAGIVGDQTEYAIVATSVVVN